MAERRGTKRPAGGGAGGLGRLLSLDYVSARDEDASPRTMEEVMANLQRLQEETSEIMAQAEERMADRVKAEAVAWDSTFEDDKGRVATGVEDVSRGLFGGHNGITKRSPWMCDTFPQLRNEAVFDAPELYVEAGGQVFGSSAAAFAYAKATYFDERLGSSDFRNAFKDLPAGASPLGDALLASAGPSGVERLGTKDGVARTLAAALGGTIAKARRLHDEIAQDWYDDEEAGDIAAMKAVLASKFSNRNPLFRDLLLATGDKDLYQLLPASKEDKIWMVGNYEQGVTTSGLGLYGDLLMARRAELRAAAA